MLFPAFSLARSYDVARQIDVLNPQTQAPIEAHPCPIEHQALIPCQPPEQRRDLLLAKNNRHLMVTFPAPRKLKAINWRIKHESIHEQDCVQSDRLGSGRIIFNYPVVQEAFEFALAEF